MRGFLIGLQFLTRISLVKQEIWTDEDFGASVRYFPLVGAVLGAVYALFAYLLFVPASEYVFQIPRHTAAAAVLLLTVALTGGIHCDGFMDTMDGLFSGRSRERMLEIMKDSRTGSNAVASFGVLLLSEYSMLLDMSPSVLIPALFSMPIVGRCMMVFAICRFPYARPYGMGKAFAEYGGKNAPVFALATAALLVSPWGGAPLLSLLASLGLTYGFGKYAAGKLGGLTGDVYGAVTMLSEALTLFLFAIFGGYIG